MLSSPGGRVDAIYAIVRMPYILTTLGVSDRGKRASSIGTKARIPT
jgi:hypothetical protein